MYAYNLVFEFVRRFEKYAFFYERTKAAGKREGEAMSSSCNSKFEFSIKYVFISAFLKRRGKTPKIPIL